MRTLLLALVFLTGSVLAAQFTFDSKPLTVPEGYEIELIAGPPLVKRPISVSMDELGRLYVTESSGNSGNAQAQMKDPQHQILRLEDTDDDGRYDKKTVYADKVMFPEGCMYLDGSVYVSAVPQIFKFTDTDGDGVADKREVWHDGKTVTGCANDLHGPYLGLDGRIYWCKGAWGQQTIERPGKEPLVTRAAHIFRARPDGSEKEWVMAAGMDNPVGVAFTPSGERILSCTFYEPFAGKRDGLIHAIYGGVYGKPNDAINDHKMTGDLMPGLTHFGAAAPCGITCYRSNRLGEFSGNLFACYFNLHKVVRHELVPDGATFTTKDFDFVSSTNVDFHPTDVLEDADGSLIVVDTGGWYKVCCPTSQIAKPDISGAVYRIRKTGAPKIDDPRGLKIAWATMAPAELAKLLGDSRTFVAQRAMRELAKKGAEGIEPLRAAIKESTSRAMRLNAVWTLARIGGEAALGAARAALKDADATVSAAAILVAGLWRDAGAVEMLIPFLTGEDASRARIAAEALGRIGDKRAVVELLAAAGRIKVTDVSPSGAPATIPERILDHSIIYALIEIGDSDSLLKRWSEKVQARRAALVAADQIQDGKLSADMVVNFLSFNELTLRNTAAWIAGHHPEWGDALAAQYRERLSNLPASDEDKKSLAQQLARLAKSPAIQELIANAVSEKSNPVALSAMSGAELKQTPDSWFEAILKTLPKADTQTLPNILQSASALPQPKGGHAGLTSALLELSKKSELSPALRIQALNAVPKPGNLDVGIFDLLLVHISVAHNPALRSQAAGVLARATLSAEQQSALAASLKFVSPLELPQLLNAFSKGGDEATGKKLVAALKSSPALSSVRPDALKNLFAQFPKSVQDAGAELIESLAADAASQAAHLQELAAKLSKGDAERGKVVFTGKANCVSCHTKGTIGANFGPDLTTVAQVRSERDLLESIVYPSATFVRSFEPYVVVTKSGEMINGILRKDAPDEVILASAPNADKRISRSEIKSMRPDTVSIMPQGFDRLLTPRELADVIAFLKSK